MADVDAAFVQQILHVAERQGKPDVEHNRQADDFRAALKALERIRFGHVPTLRGRPARLNWNLSDSANFTPLDYSKSTAECSFGH